MSTARALPGAPAALPLPAFNDSGLELTLTVTDPEVAAELRRHSGAERERLALTALRIGLLSLKMAGGQIDTGAVKQAGQALLAEIRDLLTSRATELTKTLAGELQRYLDPREGALSQRLDSLLKHDGELERVLRLHFGGDDSVLAKTLAEHVGAGSAIFRMLSPTDANGLRMQVAATLGQALADQREQILREFSLNTGDSALSRLVSEIKARQGELGADMKAQIEGVVKEFSLDRPDSALSRLVGRVELAQRTIADQFSSDNEGSAISRLSRLLQSTSDEIGRNLTLDDEASALSRLKRELVSTLDGLTQGNQRFYAEVRETLAALRATKEEASRSTRHGATFEGALVDWVSIEAQRLGDVSEAVGHTTGVIKNCKKGDCVVELGAESPAPGAKIVWEAKEDQSCDLKKALAEIDEARRNRGAQIGVFVFSKKSAPSELAPFARHGNHLVVVWDAEDTSSTVYLKAAYSVARALLLREQKHSADAAQVILGIESATRTVEKQISFLDEVETQGKTAMSAGRKIAERAEKMKADLRREVERLDAQLAALKLASAAP